MAIQAGQERDGSREMRKMLATQLSIDDGHLSGIPFPVLSRMREHLALDELTGVLNRRAGIAALRNQIAQVRRSPEPELAVAFVDLDGLKLINDRQGHAAGDTALSAVALALTSSLGRADAVFRYGGDEFVCVIEHLDLAAACRLVLQAWEELHARTRLSFSAGFAELRREDDAWRLIGRADDCLRAGRLDSRKSRWQVAS